MTEASSNDQDQQHIDARQMKSANDSPQHDHGNGHAQANRERSEIDRSARLDRLRKAVKQVLPPVALIDKAEQIADLAERDQHAGAGHKAEHDRFGDVSGQIAELE